MNKPRILLADDDQDMINLLKLRLEGEGLEVVTAMTGNEALQLIADSRLSLIILDIVMPDASGLEICRTIRDRTPVPIILLSAKDREIDKVVGLELGADDYITKPFSLDELTARIKSHIRREQRQHSQHSGDSSILTLGSLSIHKQTYEVYMSGEKVPLSTKEFLILAYMAENKGIVLNREQIYQAVWGYVDDGDLNTVTVYLKNIRKKLGEGNTCIVTIWGVGYKFVPPAAVSSPQ
jgi:two-component system, OmpR family, lantibiotic biosynthesis response regulator NisR/SpaR